VGKWLSGRSRTVVGATLGVRLLCFSGFEGHVREGGVARPAERRAGVDKGRVDAGH
jgi:hypothetical protein